MNAREIEALARQIEENVRLNERLASQEAIRYIQEHQEQIVQELARQGSTRVLTSFGEFRLTLDDLRAAA